ncbi:MAG: hypothetical protein WC378_17375 [Opitutaceae bacterium]|jgi:hypothetical protein
MDWLQDHLQIIIVVAGAIAYWLNQRRHEKQGLPADYDGDGTPETKPSPPAAYDPASMEVEEAERTRRLMEEMRRKRAERSANSGAPIAPSPAQPPVVSAPPRRFETTPPVFTDPLAEMMKDLARRYAPQPEPAPAPAGIGQEVLARQRALEERLRQLDDQKNLAMKKVAELRRAPP